MLHLNHRCYTMVVPTTRHRFSITESDDLARVLDAAAGIWPEHADDRAELLRLVVRWGGERVLDVAQERRQERLAAIRETAGALSDVYPPNAAQLLKDEWPE